MNLDIVTHCYCPDGMPHYANLLGIQCASILQAANDTSWDTVGVHIWWCRRDNHTALVANTMNSSGKVRFMPCAVDSPSFLFRRAAGRNISARSSMADVIWFADCDYIFTSQCLESLHSLSDRNCGLLYPQSTMISLDHETGDNVTAELCADYCKLKSILSNESLWVHKRESRAIGGIQIVGANSIKRIGYLDETKWVRVDDTATKFSFGCDIAFRKIMGDGDKLDIRGLYRLRHSTHGY